MYFYNYNDQITIEWLQLQFSKYFLCVVSWREAPDYVIQLIHNKARRRTWFI